MSSLGKVVYLSQAQFATLVSSGSVTVGGVTVTYSADDLYITPTPEIPMPSASDNGRVLGVTDSTGSLGWVSLQYDLPYALVTPGEWEFINKPIDYEFVSMAFASGTWTVTFSQGGTQFTLEAAGSETDLSVEFYADEKFTATRPSLPGHLLDRAVNAVTVTDATTLTFPAANPGHMRDLLVRLTVSATSAVTWAVAQGESWDAMGAPPSSFTSGTYLYRFTEVAAGVWHFEDMLALVGLEAALAGKMPMYPMVAVAPSSGTLTVAPYTVATYTAGSSAAAFTVAVGAGTTGKIRDCILVIDGTATGAVAPTVTWPSNFHPRTDAGTDFACEATRNVYYISEYAAGQFVVGGWQETAGGNS